MKSQVAWVKKKKYMRGLVGTDSWKLASAAEI